MKTRQVLPMIFVISLLIACNSTETKKTTEVSSKDNQYIPKEYVQVQHPEWSKNAAIYQLNTRQFSAEGTFRAAQKELPRLKEMGIDIIWLMPINPIGEKNRKGTLGSPYSVKDYYGVNPEFGTLDDLKAFVKEAHQLGLYVILDWVANHTAWDNNLVTEHPEWYKRDYKGNFRPTPWWDWDDIIDLDYSKPELRKYMTEAMKYWVKEADIDGYRCDVAGFVPIDFWDNLRVELDAIKPVFMLAEWESRDMHANAFDMTYAWSWNEKLHKICKGQANVNELYIYYSWNESFFPNNSIRMTFVSNHDKNAWEGTMWEQFGDGLEAAIVLSVVGDGMPLIYNGQEAGEPKRLAFFEKDPIIWKQHPIGDLYKKLFTLMKQNTALWHAQWGALMIKVPNTNETEVFSFVRQNEKDKVFCVFNFSTKTQNVTFKDDLYHGTYRDFTTQEMITFKEDTTFSMAPWSYKVFVKE
ncbi:MAG TPA: alpha-amylase family glycosyl hydrolase [Flavobacterium sp.]|uniref:alpha-amylase family glycosyl hydrolase n=2 Tax=Flavobacterium TaxID=237 RepID=UPI0025BAC785|nr:MULTISPECIES: alpha-amylase family glycosyl hydrolase [unclassified Flavobacterium]HRE78189.1 alpha-amylase family glycosyl hydrolase [Flavobacterium sp.]